MPGLKMAIETCKNSKRCHDLLACCTTSNKLPEESRYRVKRSRQASVLDTSTQLNYDDLPSTERLNHNIQNTDADDDLATLSGPSAHCLMFPLLTSDSAVVGDMVSLSPAYPPILETIFSPAFEQNETQFKPMNQSNSVREGENLDLPQLVSIDSNDQSCTSTNAKSLGLWDFYSSEVACLPFDDVIELSDSVTTVSQDYEQMLSDMVFDKEDTCMGLPSLDKPVDLGSICDDKSVKDVWSSDDSFLYLAIQQLTSKSETEINYSYCDLDEVEFDPQLFLRNLPDLLEANCPDIPKETVKRKPITLVLDLDETLVHSTLEHCDDADFTFPVFFNMKNHTVYVRRRPHLQTFLERVAEMFEVVIFTASQSIYAEQLLDILDPEKNLISHRLYRESCTFSNGNCTKDLTVLGLDLAKVAIVDNTPQVFQLQVNNGIPIKSWFDDPSDEALIALLPFLETLVDADDVRPIIEKRFSHKE
ncbi:CTD small phosphatase-like protein 2 isoform X1 [Iris pallida]|uniref:CTD small phosphatase-like protein 2 isoform X1 n=1 Tax=Iris pallida TaxID=29817 RepID=A0AAX6DJL1_IRIPA|nr:CTD small phosphatase-like protein 2 isoform X1 [Iris pallida]